MPTQKSKTTKIIKKKTKNKTNKNNEKKYEKRFVYLA